MNKPITDHKGNQFPSISAMAKHYNLPTSTLHNRLLRHWTLEEALTIPNDTTKACKVMPKDKEYIYDHLGNKYTCVREMAEHYGITEKQYWARKRTCKWPLEKILTTPVYEHPSNSKQVVDHLGNTFATISEMCRFWGMTRSTYNARIKNNWTVEAALTTPQKKINTQKQEWVDHKGQHYPSLSAMCQTYGITHHTFKTRVDKLNWSVEKALTTKKIINSIAITDKEGNTFPSLTDMAHYYHIPVHFLQGKDLSNPEKIISKGLISNRIITDRLTINKLIAFPYFQVNYDNQTMILKLNQILDIYHSDNFYPLPDRKISLKGFEITESLAFPNYKVCINGNIETWSYWDIINYCHDNNFGISTDKGR